MLEKEEKCFRETKILAAEKGEPVEEIIEIFTQPFLADCWIFGAH